MNIEKINYVRSPEVKGDESLAAKRGAFGDPVTFDLTTAAGENPASSLPALAGHAVKFLDPISYPPIQVAGGASISH